MKLLPAPKRKMSTLFALLTILLLIAPTLAWPQATVSTGSIVGTVSDPTGAAVPGAKVTITNTATSAAKTTTTNNRGLYNSGALEPGSYTVRVEAKGFSATETQVAAQVGNVSTVNVKLTLGSESQTVNVEAGAVAVNTEQILGAGRSYRPTRSINCR